MSDSRDVDLAVIAKLSGDAALTGVAGLLPGGVSIDINGSDKTKFVIVSMLAHDDSYMFNGTAFERFLYLIKAVDKSNSPLVADAGAKRIHELMQMTTLAITGYTHVHTRRDERIVITEVDDIDRNIRWQHRGGHYEIVVSPN